MSDSPLLLGQHKVVKFGPLRFWAERGLISCEDSRDGGYKTLPVHTIRDRLKAIGEMVKNSKGLDAEVWGVPLKKHKDFIDSMEYVCKLAEEQGQPGDKSMLSKIQNAKQKIFVLPNTFSKSVQSEIPL